ncbi:hypothetical protein Y032_0061g3258 [Ancylostoma ceylanicum]|nr:hypothetical protein Y032_0061g3258 [Ancylostoma ceylanicum]
MACNFLGYSTLWAHREIKQRGERYVGENCQLQGPFPIFLLQDARRKVPAHVAIINNDQALNKNSLMSLIEAALVENIRRLTIYDASKDYTDLAGELRMFCRSKHIKIIVGCADFSDDFSSYRLFVHLLSSNSGRSTLVETCRELSTSKDPITSNDITTHLASKYSLLEPELLIQVGSTPSLSGYPPWCLRVTEIVPVRSLPCNRFAFEECLEAFNKRDIRLGK